MALTPHEEHLAKSRDLAGFLLDDLRESHGSADSPAEHWLLLDWIAQVSVIRDRLATLV